MTWLDVESQEAIDHFWDSLSEYESVFPRPIEQIVQLALPVRLVSLQKLALNSVSSWLAQREVPVNLDFPNRRLHGCLIAYQDRGFIFIDSNDPENERRFTVAHEVSHFILDYLNPRKRAINAFGDSILDVLRGERQPTTAETLGAAIQSVPINLTVQLMERTGQSGFTVEEVRGVEDRADRMALALLAPPQIVLSEVSLEAPKFVERHAELSAILTQKFELPEKLAQQYSYSLLIETGRGPSWIESLDFN